MMICTWGIYFCISLNCTITKNTSNQTYICIKTYQFKLIVLKWKQDASTVIQKQISSDWNEMSAPLSGHFTDNCDHEDSCLVRLTTWILVYRSQHCDSACYPLIFHWENRRKKFFLTKPSLLFSSGCGKQKDVTRMLLWHICSKQELWSQRQPLLANGSETTFVSRQRQQILSKQE
jgi:hypothetical protein